MPTFPYSISLSHHPCPTRMRCSKCACWRFCPPQSQAASHPNSTLYRCRWTWSCANPVARRVSFPAGCIVWLPRMMESGASSEISVVGNDGPMGKRRQPRHGEARRRRSWYWLCCVSHRTDRKGMLDERTPARLTGTFLAPDIGLLRAARMTTTWWKASGFQWAIFCWLACRPRIYNGFSGAAND